MLSNLSWYGEPLRTKCIFKIGKVYTKRTKEQNPFAGKTKIKIMNIKDGYIQYIFTETDGNKIHHASINNTLIKWAQWEFEED